MNQQDSNANDEEKKTDASWPNEITQVLSQLDHESLFVGYDGINDAYETDTESKSNSDQKKPKWRKPTDVLVDYSIFSNTPLAQRQNIIKTCSSSNPTIDRCIGCMAGMAIGDAVGAPLEFQAIDFKPDVNRPRFILNEQTWINPKNKFRLKPGQFTDDASMGLCIADSLLLQQQFDGSDMRIRFWNWWFNAYNNAFHNDCDERGNADFCEQNNLAFFGLTSVGLGQNISKSLLSMAWNVTPTAAYEPTIDSEDSGNGSLIRLAPIPIFYHADMGKALQYAALSSFTTHPGFHASEACKLLCFVLVSAVQRDDKDDDMKTFLEKATVKYLKERLHTEMDEISLQLKNAGADGDVNVLGVSSNKLQRELDAKMLIQKLIESAEGVQSKELCWNWKCSVDTYRANLLACMNTRKWGYKQESKESDDDYPGLYNNYPVESEYFGSYCMDGLAMALNAAYNSDSFGTAVENAVNLLGDADSTGSIAGQIAGAFYGYRSVVEDEKQSFLFEQLVKWDDYAFALHGVLLYFAN